METPLPKRILVPTDFSEPSRIALQRAAGVAEACSAKLTVMYADEFMPLLDEVAGRPDTNTKEQEQRAISVAEAELKKEVAELVPSSVAVETLIVVDKPVHAILQVAKEKNADWIVMGTHGRTGVRRVMLGSVTEEVLRNSDRPVLTIRANE